MTTRHGSNLCAFVGVTAMQLALVACGSHDCTVVGFQSGVQVVVPSRMWSVAEFCVEERCIPAAVDGGGFIPVSEEGAAYSFRLRVVSPEGEEFVREGSVETKPYRINGPGCDPLTANAVVRVGDDGKVSIESP